MDIQPKDYIIVVAPPDQVNAKDLSPGASKDKDTVSKENSGVRGGRGIIRSYNPAGYYRPLGVRTF